MGSHEHKRGHVRAVTTPRAGVLRSVWTAVFLFISSLFIVLPQVAAAQNYSFSQVAIDGNERIEPGTILSYAGIARGQPVSAGELNEAYQRVLGSGLFETVEFVPQGNRLLIRVQEWPMINIVNIEGNRRIDDEDLLGLIQSQSRRVYSPSVAEQDAQTITEAYRQAGRLAATVSPRSSAATNNRVDLIFEVSEGRVVEIERLSFVGNREYSDRRCAACSRPSRPGSCAS
jgi:outer membrane protein insertion porin family